MPRSVLVVDDHPGFRSFLSRYLTESGYRVVGGAADGASALREAARLKPDIVLLDVHLLDDDGFEIARRLAAGPASPAVVMISSRDDPDYTARAVASSTRGFLAKSRLSRASLERILG
jgi:DNA-binding NarL/FixJ family response regulator